MDHKGNILMIGNIVVSWALNTMAESETGSIERGDGLFFGESFE